MEGCCEHKKCVSCLVSCCFLYRAFLLVLLLKVLASLRARLRGAANNSYSTCTRCLHVSTVNKLTQSHPSYVRNYQNEARNGGKGQL